MDISQYQIHHGGGGGEPETPGVAYNSSYNIIYCYSPQSCITTWSYNHVVTPAQAIRLVAELTDQSCHPTSSMPLNGST